MGKNKLGFLGAEANIRFFKDINVSSQQSSTVGVARYGLIFIFENGSAGCYGIFGIIGTSLYKIASTGYSAISSEPTTFMLSLNESGMTILNTTAYNTKHSVLCFAAN